jgi:hypothetical protein
VTCQIVILTDGKLDGGEGREKKKSDAHNDDVDLSIFANMNTYILYKQLIYNSINSVISPSDRTLCRSFFGGDGVRSVRTSVGPVVFF